MTAIMCDNDNFKKITLLLKSFGKYGFNLTLNSSFLYIRPFRTLTLAGYSIPAIKNNPLYNINTQKAEEVVASDSDELLILK